MEFDVDLFLQGLTQECDRATDHFRLRPGTRSREDASMILDGMYHGVEVTLKAIHPDHGEALEAARSIILAHQERLRIPCGS